MYKLGRSVTLATVIIHFVLIYCKYISKINSLVLIASLRVRFSSYLLVLKTRTEEVQRLG